MKMLNLLIIFTEAGTSILLLMEEDFQIALIFLTRPGALIALM
jgi:hypothetical protein